MKVADQEIKWYEFASLMVFGNISCLGFTCLSAYFASIGYPWYWPLILAALTGVMPKTTKDN